MFSDYSLEVNLHIPSLILPDWFTAWCFYSETLTVCLQARGSRTPWWARRSSPVWSPDSAAPCSAGLCRRPGRERASPWRSPTWRFTTRRSETCSTPKGEELFSPGDIKMDSGTVSVEETWTSPSEDWLYLFGFFGKGATQPCHVGSWVERNRTEQNRTGGLITFPLCRSRAALRVREHNVFGPYVDGLSRLAVASYKVTVTPSRFSSVCLFPSVTSSRQGKNKLLHKVWVFVCVCDRTSSLWCQREINLVQSQPRIWTKRAADPTLCSTSSSHTHSWTYSLG